MSSVISTDQGRNSKALSVQIRICISSENGLCIPYIGSSALAVENDEIIVDCDSMIIFSELS